MAKKRLPARKRKGRIPKRPADMVVSADGGFTISWPWIEPGYRVWILLPYLPVLAVAAFALSQTVPGGAAGPVWRTPVTVAALTGIVLATWAALAAAVNRKTVRLAAGWLTKTHHPLYWPGGRRFRAADIEQITVQEDRSSGEDGEDLVTYRLLVRVRGSFARTLVEGIDDHGEAEYVRNRLTVALGLKDGDGQPA